MKKSFQRVIATLNWFQGKQSLTIFLLAAIFALTACDDSSSAGGDDVILSGDSREESSDSRSNDKDEAISSNGKVESNRSSSSAKETKDSSDTKSSSSVKSGDSSSSSSAGKVESSSSKGEVPKSYAETKVMPSGTFDCSKYNCFTTENLNQEFLEAGKYGEILDERDGQVYKTIQIGTQTWMAQNLNYAYTGIPYNYHSYMGYTSDSTSWCYGNTPANCTKYGRLYTWATAMDSVGTWSTNGKGCGYSKTCSPTYPMRGVCPEGWHLPTRTEWETLFVAVGEQSMAGRMLKSTTSAWKRRGNSTDAYAFSALPAGKMYDYVDFFGEGFLAPFWSSSECTDISAYHIRLYYIDDDAYLDSEFKNYGLSVRCVKDSD